jgi:glycosidase
MTKVASALEFTVPGIPLLFGGDEIGARYQPYGPIEKIPWRDRSGFRAWYDGLIALRRRLPALRSPEIRVLGSDWGSVIAYVRPGVPGGSPVLVLLNFSKAATPTFDPDPALDQVLEAGELEDALTGDRYRVDPGSRSMFHLPPFAVRILVPAGGSS